MGEEELKEILIQQLDIMKTRVNMMWELYEYISKWECIHNRMFSRI